MKRSGKIVIGIIIAAAVIFFIALQAMEGVDVEVKKVMPERIARSFTEEGIMKAGVEYTVYPMYRARINSLLVREGDLVEKGDLLVVLDERELQYKKAGLNAALDELTGEELKLTEQPGKADIQAHNLAIQQADERLKSAQREYNRKKVLYKDNALSEHEYDKARDLLIERELDFALHQKALEVLFESYDPPPGSREIIDARRLVVSSQIDRLLYQLREYKIYSPVTGYVGRLAPEEQEPADPQSPLMTIFQDDDLHIEVDVLSRDVIDLSPGMMVRVSVDLKGKEIEFPGEILKIAHHAEKDISPLGLEERRVEVIVSLSIPEDIILGPGYDVDVTFIAEEYVDQLVVPKLALFTWEGQDALFVAENGRARIRQVTTGFETQREVVITDGLVQGDRVILNPRTSGLDDGVRINIK